MDIMSLLMAKRAGGNTPSGGGSVNSVNGVQPDEAGNVALKYDDLDNRPFGEETIVTDVYPEITVTVKNNQAILNKKITLEVGKTYFVTWDGTEYECVAENVSFDGAPAVAVGNPYFTGGSNNNMPFALGHSDYAGMSLAVAMTDGDHTFDVKCDSVVVKTIDSKYLPEGYPAEEKSITYSPFDIEWDGNSDGKVIATDEMLSMDVYYTKLSDTVPAADDLNNGYIEVGGRQGMIDGVTAWAESLSKEAAGIFIQGSMVPMIVAVYEPCELTSDVLTVPVEEPGLYFCKVYGTYLNKLHLDSVGTVETTIKTLDPKFMPNPADLSLEWIAALKTALGI